MILDKFEQLKRRYISSFEQKQTDIKNVWNEKNVKELESLLHKLAGSSGSYEFHHLSLLCRQTLDCINENSEIVAHKPLENHLKALFAEMDKYAKS
ncbi:MAG: Hpt domain-containing protein [Proteobacteria bacterium]|nr:Hpt domain-containing protein [Pseudomonadota bacterium]